MHRWVYPRSNGLSGFGLLATGLSVQADAVAIGVYTLCREQMLGIHDAPRGHTAAVRTVLPRSV